MISKTECRKNQKKITQNISEKELKIKSKKILEILFNSNILDKAETVFVYYSYRREVSTVEIINKLLSLNKTVLIPKCDLSTETMTAVLFNENIQLVENEYGIKETSVDEEYNEKIDLAIVPAVAFDKRGNRLGRGKGYYDKFFKRHNLCKVGLCYSENLTDEEIPHNADDIPMDYIISDRGVLNF